MPYNIENIFICLAAPFLLAALGTNTGNRKNYIFIVLGFVCCIISAYLNTFFSAIYGAQGITAVLEISPVIEETVKLIPLLFGLIVFEIEPREGNNVIFNIAVGFATFENICYLLENGTDNLFYLFVRGFSTGAMHITCAFIIGYGLRVFRRPAALRAAGIFGLLCVAITFHATFNMLMKADGLIKQFGYAVPIASCLILLLLKVHFRKLTDSNHTDR